jgi:hypothetical protein
MQLLQPESVRFMLRVDEDRMNVDGRSRWGPSMALSMAMRRLSGCEI